MTPHPDDHSAINFPDTELWDPENWAHPAGFEADDDPTRRILEWLTLEDCESLDTDEWGIVVNANLRGIEYHVGSSTDPSLGDAEIISTLVMGSPMPTELLTELVTTRLPHPLPNGLVIEVDELGENDAHCWLVRRFTGEQLEDDGGFEVLMEEFVAITEAFVVGWSAAG